MESTHRSNRFLVAKEAALTSVVMAPGESFPAQEPIEVKDLSIRMALMIMVL